MKKFFILLISVALMLSFSSCDSEGSQSGGTLKGEVDLDLTSLDTYNTLLAFSTNPSDYQGKTIAVKATNSVLYNFSQNTITHIMLGYDPSGCCNAYYGIKTADGIYPANDAETVFEGEFSSDGYIAISGYASDEAQTKTDIDALDMSSSELEDFIYSYYENYESDEYYGKTIRIFGHLEKQDIYYYFLGLDASGQQTWVIELYEPTGNISFPLTAQYILNPVEIIGTLSSYVENGIVYPCIQVTDVNHVEGSFD